LFRECKRVVHQELVPPSQNVNQKCMGLPETARARSEKLEQTCIWKRALTQQSSSFRRKCPSDRVLCEFILPIKKNHLKGSYFETVEGILKVTTAVLNHQRKNNFTEVLLHLQIMAIFLYSRRRELL
jgi:hypothetical protein